MEYYVQPKKTQFNPMQQKSSAITTMQESGYDYTKHSENLLPSNLKILRDILKYYINVA